DPAVGVEAVHLNEQLVERLLALVVAADRAAAARLAQRVQLVDEDDARGAALGLAEQVAHAAGPDADEHLDEVRARQAEERHVGLARDRLGQQRLARARRADQEHALGDAAAEALVLLGALEAI